MTDDPIFSKNVSIAATFREIVRDTIVLLTYQVNNAFGFSKDFHGMGHPVYIFWNIR